MSSLFGAEYVRGRDVPESVDSEIHEHHINRQILAKHLFPFPVTKKKMSTEKEKDAKASELPKTESSEQLSKVAFYS